MPSPMRWGMGGPLAFSGGLRRYSTMHSCQQAYYGLRSCACSLTTQRPDKYPTRVDDGACQEDWDASGDGLIALLPPAQLLRVHISADDAVYGPSGACSEGEKIAAPRLSAMDGFLLASTFQVRVAGPGKQRWRNVCGCCGEDLRSALRNCTPPLHLQFCSIPSTWLTYMHGHTRHSYGAY